MSEEFPKKKVISHRNSFNRIEFIHNKDSQNKNIINNKNLENFNGKNKETDSSIYTLAGKRKIRESSTSILKGQDNLLRRFGTERFTNKSSSTIDIIQNKVTKSKSQIEKNDKKSNDNLNDISENNNLNKNNLSTQFNYLPNSNNNQNSNTNNIIRISNQPLNLVNNNNNEVKETYPVKFNIDNSGSNSQIVANEEKEREILNIIKNRIRMMFVRKVYTISSTQLLLSLIINCLSFDYYVKDFFIDNYALLSFGILLFVGSLCLVAFKKDIVKHVPYNYILLLIFTLGISLILLFLSACFTPIKIIIIWVCLILMSSSIILMSFCFQTKIHTIFSLLIIMIISVTFLISLLIFSNFFFGSETAILFCVLASLGGVFFGLYLIFHTQILMKENVEIDTDRYIIASMQIYSDVILIFINLLCTLSAN